MLHIKSFFFNAFQERCVVLWDDGGHCAVVDPGFYTDEERRALEEFIEKENLKPEKILLTHAHFDHIFGVKECALRYGIPVMMHPADRTILDNEDFFCRMFGLKTPQTDFSTEDIADGDKVRVGSEEFEVIATPGHTPGGVCWLDREAKVLFSGDTLFAGSIGRTDNQWGDYDALISGILTRLMALDGDTDVVPGHGPCTTIADERMKNPFLLPFNEPIEDEE